MSRTVPTPPAGHRLLDGKTVVVTAAAGTGRSELTLATKDGKHVISGAGRDDQGPYNFILTKQ